jgi:hypothetical protein
MLPETLPDSRLIGLSESAQASGATQSLRPPLFWFVAAAVFLIEVVLTAHHEVFNLPGLDAYWAYEWAGNYAHGFVRRGLLGSLLQWLHLDSSNYLILLALSWAISLALFLMLAQTVWKLSAGLNSGQRLIFVTALLLSPLTAGMIVETTGDPLQLIFLAYFLLFHVFVTRGKKALLTGAVFLLFGATAALIHEASLFFIAPVLLVAAFVLTRTATARAAFFGYIAGAVPVILAIVLGKTHQVAQNAVPQLHIGSRVSFWIAPPDESFSYLLHQEHLSWFSRGMHGYGALAAHISGSLILPVFFSLLILTFFFSPDHATRSQRSRVALAFLLPFLLSAPLYFVAHDWGRFVAYGFILTIPALAQWKLPRVIKSLGGRKVLLGASLLLAGITTTPLLQRYRLGGLSDNPKVLFCSILVIATAIYLSRRLPGPDLIGPNLPKSEPPE